MAKKVKNIDGFIPRKPIHAGPSGPARRAGRTIPTIKSQRGFMDNDSFEVPVRRGAPPMRHARNSRQKMPVEGHRRLVGAMDLTSEDIERDIEKNAPKHAKKGKKGHKQGKQPKKKWSKKRKILTFLVILVILVLGIGAALLIWGNGILNKISNGSFGLWEVLTAKDVELKKDANGRTNLLVLGTSGYDMGGTDHDGAQLTDSIMIISVDQANNDVAMLSLPRDLYVGNTCTDTGKVNEIYWCNNQDETDELGGAQAAMREIGEILGLDFQYYAHINWGALVQVVDALGGVTVTLDEDIADDWTETYIKAGVPTTLDGERALGLARARHGTASGDFTRGNSQQKILLAIRDKMVENGVSLLQVMDLMGVVGDNVRTDFNADEIKTLYNLAKDFPMEHIRQISLYDPEGVNSYVTTGTINGISYVLPVAGAKNYSQIQKLLKKMLSSDGIQREGASVMVLNGTETSGVAGAEETALATKGIDVAEIGNAPQDACLAHYCIYDFSEGKMPVTLQKLQEIYGVEVIPKSGYPIPYYTEPPYDFIIIIGEKAE